MDDTYVSFRKKQNIRPITFAKKAEYYFDLQNIEDSWSGRMDTNICNTFIIEAEQQLINAIELFELGYFDCAYYSLRSAIDMSTTMVFLSDMPEDEREKYFNAWKSTQNFPLQSTMKQQLSKYGDVFVDMLEKMPDFFDSAKELNTKINKYVHKQGLQHFYVARNHPVNWDKSQEAFKKVFEEYLEKSIGVVAVMRLAIDPFPILLMDEEILYRCFNSMTNPYSEEFVKKYIGYKTIEQYKQTGTYTAMYDYLINNEKKDVAVFDVMKYQFIDTKSFDKIFEQFDLLSQEDVICVLLAHACEKVVKVYCCGGFIMYFTDKNTQRTAHSWCGEDFKRFAESEIPMNHQYDEAYISVFTFVDEKYYIEHNEKLDITEFEQIFNSVVNQIEKIKNL